MVKRWRLLICLAALSLFLLSPDGICRFSQPGPYMKRIIVKRGDSLYRICVRYYGAFSPEVMLLIRRYNPSLKLSGVIRPGDTLTLPYVKDPGDYPAAPKEKGAEGPGSFGEKRYTVYPSPMDAQISKLEWISDNTALVSGEIRIPRKAGLSISFFVSVPGDADYEQPLQIKDDDTFESLVCIGRPYQDYGADFILKLRQSINGKVVTEIRQQVVKQEDPPRIITFQKTGRKSSVVGEEGLEKWIETQTVPQNSIDNKQFRVKDGLVVKNYRFIEYNPDEQYLSRFGRITLYGSATLAKALVLKGDAERAKRILNVWAAQMDERGGIPRSANTLGDTYISPDVRSGDMAHFLGALALVKAVSGTKEYDGVITKISTKYFRDLQDKTTGLVWGGYSFNGDNQSGEDKVQPVLWASAEHNFDVFQSFLLLSKMYPGETGVFFRDFATRVGAGLDTYMWDPEAGTFNRGYRLEGGSDKARAPRLFLMGHAVSPETGKAC